MPDVDAQALTDDLRMEWNGVLRHISKERLFCAENSKLFDWTGLYGTATNTGHTAIRFEMICNLRQ